MYVRALRKYRPIVAAVAVTILAAACGSSATGGGSASQPAAKAPLKVGFSLPALDEYYSVVQQTAVSYAKKKGVDLLVGDGTTGADPTNQIAKVQNLLAEGVRVLLISPQGTGLIPVLNRAVSAGVKVIFIDQQIPTFTKAVAFIGTDNQAGSTLMGNYLVKALHGRGEVGIMQGVPGTPVSMARSTNLKNILQKAGIKVDLSSQADDCQEDVAVGVFRNFLVSHPSVSGVFSICGPTGLAVDKVLSQHKGGKKVLSTSWDVFVQQVQNILAGTETAAVAQFPVKLADLAINNAITVAGGRAITEVIGTGTEIVTKANASQFFHTGNSGYAYLLNPS